MAYPSVNKVLVKVLNGANVLANSSAISNPLDTALGKVLFMKASAEVYFQLVGAKIAGVKIIKSARERVTTLTVGNWGTAANTEYGFYLRQDVPNKAAATGSSDVYISVSFLSAPTSNQVQAALVAQVNSFAASGKIKASATYTAGASTFPIVADAGYPILVSPAQVGGVTVVNGIVAIAPNGTPSSAIVDRFTLASLAGTSVVTATFNDHGLLPGDVVSISGVTGFQFYDSRTGASLVGAVNDVVIDSVTANTFTLQNIGGNGTGSAGTIVCQVKNKVRVLTLNPHGLVVGDKVDLTWAAATTFILNGSGAARTLAGLRVQSIGTTSQFWVDGVWSSGTNSTAFTITPSASEAVGIGANLITLGVKDTFAATPVPALDAVTAASYYTEVVIDYVSAKGVNGLSVPALGEQAETVKLYVEESATDYNSAIFRIGQVAQRVGWNSYYPDPSL
jgi:hypothetical protein